MWFNIVLVVNIWTAIQRSDTVGIGFLYGFPLFFCICMHTQYTRVCVCVCSISGKHWLRMAENNNNREDSITKNATQYEEENGVKSTAKWWKSFKSTETYTLYAIWASYAWNRNLPSSIFSHLSAYYEIYSVQTHVSLIRLFPRFLDFSVHVE